MKIADMVSRNLGSEKPFQSKRRLAAGSLGNLVRINERPARTEMAEMKAKIRIVHPQPREEDRVENKRGKATPPKQPAEVARPVAKARLEWNQWPRVAMLEVQRMEADRPESREKERICWYNSVFSLVQHAWGQGQSGWSGRRGRGAWAKRGICKKKNGQALTGTKRCTNQPYNHTGTTHGQDESQSISIKQRPDEKPAEGEQECKDAEDPSYVAFGVLRQLIVMEPRLENACGSEET